MTFWGGLTTFGGVGLSLVTIAMPAIGVDQSVEFVIKTQMAKDVGRRGQATEGPVQLMFCKVHQTTPLFSRLAPLFHAQYGVSDGRGRARIWNARKAVQIVCPSLHHSSSLF